MSFAHECPESWAAEYRKWNRDVMPDITMLGPSHHIIEYEFEDGSVVEYCVHCGELYTSLYDD